MRKNNKYYIRKVHRYLGVIIGIQFLFWTISGLYFTWTDLDEIHGDHFLRESIEQRSVNSQRLNMVSDSMDIYSLELKLINDEAFFWVNDSVLIHAKSGISKTEISAEEAKSIVKDKIKPKYQIEKANFLTETGAHHEVRSIKLPVWQIEFKGAESLKAYVDARNGDFQTMRHQDWRWFDFLWMTHTMDYVGRDDFNNTLIRVFSAFGLLTVSSGFLLFFVTIKKRRKKKL